MATKTGRRTAGAATHRAYFAAIAEARYVLRRVFRLVDEHVKRRGLDPLPHQALIQVFGSTNEQLTVRELAQRLDIAPPFASMLARDLEAQGLLRRGDGDTDRRTTPLTMTPKGRALLVRIDAEMLPVVNAFTDGLPPAARRIARSVLMFHSGRRPIDADRTAPAPRATRAPRKAKPAPATKRRKTVRSA